MRYGYILLATGVVLGDTIPPGALARSELDGLRERAATGLQPPAAWLWRRCSRGHTVQLFSCLQSLLLCGVPLMMSNAATTMGGRSQGSGRRTGASGSLPSCSTLSQTLDGPLPSLPGRAVGGWGVIRWCDELLAVTNAPAMLDAQLSRSAQSQHLNHGCRPLVELFRLIRTVKGSHHNGQIVERLGHIIVRRTKVLSIAQSRW